MPSDQIKLQKGTDHVFYLTIPSLTTEVHEHSIINMNEQARYIELQPIKEFILISDIKPIKSNTWFTTDWSFSSNKAYNNLTFFRSTVSTKRKYTLASKLSTQKPWELAEK